MEDTKMCLTAQTETHFKYAPIHFDNNTLVFEHIKKSSINFLHLTPPQKKQQLQTVAQRPIQSQENPVNNNMDTGLRMKIFITNGKTEKPISKKREFGLFSFN